MRSVLVLASVVLMTACQTHQISHDVDVSSVRLAQLRARAARSSALLKLADQPEWERGRVLGAKADSLRWQDELGRSVSLHQSDVEAVRFDRRRAALLGWSVIGLSAGALVGLSLGDDEEWWRVPELYHGAGGGGLIGVVVGLEYGLPITYRFR